MSIRRLLTLENVGQNGNYWSSSLNDSDNAWNLNFNDGNQNTNNNNRNNGFSVRAVRCSNCLMLFPAHFFMLNL